MMFLVIRDLLAYYTVKVADLQWSLLFIIIFWDLSYFTRLLTNVEANLGTMMQSLNLATGASPSSISQEPAHGVFEYWNSASTSRGTSVILLQSGEENLYC